MKWRYAVIVLVVLLVAAVRVAVGVPQTPAPSQTFTGQVDIAMGADGKLLVLVDEGTPTVPSDGVVEHAFRLQGVDSVAYSGQATVTYTRGRLTVQITPESGWVFSVSGRTLPPPDPGLVALTVGGISHMWGDSVHQPPATVFSTLTSATCSKTPTSSLLTMQATADAGDAPCKNCEAGGPGTPSCSIDCDGGMGCDADCGSEMFACCSCPGTCGCCGAIEGGAHH